MAKIEAPGWDAVVLICKDCRKRRDGPKSPRPKEMVRALRQAVRADRPRPKVLLASCLGMCPKKATAVARVGGQSRIMAVATESSLAVKLLMP